MCVVRQRKMRLFLLALASAANSLPAAATIALPIYFGSSMVIQAGLPNNLWGVDAPGATVTVTYAGQRLTAPPCDATGRFSLTLPAQPVSATPTTLVVSSTSGAPTVTLDDILHGDTYWCGAAAMRERDESADGRARH